eukprot:CAMPEP_0184311866 /NCGR_PEP_ID=MMETSP1049-20130417/46080_1 /TAXON_ID=77928 /ORGANISM="Proteomonas sulcata, Strain CCMP704" /LENGTH=97 /DNA_ID=CAMNT_0026627607 /DNA_START=27 /DNA_END=317 /DNA_ORIENTATION=-
MGGLLYLGGAFAFFKKGSKASLIASGIIGTAFIGSGLIIQGGQNRNGHAIAALASLALVGGMAPRAVKTGKFMPAGLVASLGAVSGIYQAHKVNQWW